MGGRGTFANGNNVSYTYELDKSIYKKYFRGLEI